ncbi:unnamed protein product, partial [Ectocarpus sp. 12 AP-2014]
PTSTSSNREQQYVWGHSRHQLKRWGPLGDTSLWCTWKHSSWPWCHYSYSLIRPRSRHLSRKKYVSFVNNMTPVDAAPFYAKSTIEVWTTHLYSGRNLDPF